MHEVASPHTVSIEALLTAGKLLGPRYSEMKYDPYTFLFRYEQWDVYRYAPWSTRLFVATNGNHIVWSDAVPAGKRSLETAFSLARQCPKP